MTREQVKIWMKTGREIEWEYKGKQYSLCPFLTANKEKWVSFCEFNEENLDAKDVDTLWNLTYKGISVKEIFESVSENSVDVF